MPELKVPADMCHFTDTYSYEDNYKTDSVSSRSSSPKSVSDTDFSLSESSESPEGSVISDLELEAERIANDLDNMKITEIQAEEMMKEGMDMRHVLQAAWKLKPKITKKFKKGVKLNGSAVLKLLNFAAYDEKDEDDQTTKMSRAWAQYEKGLNSKRTRAPPGFENIDTVIEKRRAVKEQEQILVSYANGTNTFNLATEPMTVHGVTISCVLDSCRGFVQQTNNPTFVGLQNLEEEMHSNYSLETGPGAQLMRPIAPGSVVAVNTDQKWYRCQVVSYNPSLDTCDVKFVDHGGYTTIAADDLRQLKSEFLRLPFQAIEVYFAHVRPADHEIEIDIASEILFNTSVSLQLVGTAEDGVAMVQAYYYDGDYVNLFTQEVIDTCMAEVPHTFLAPALESAESETTSDVTSSDTSSPSPLCTPETTSESECEVPPNCPAPEMYPTEYMYPAQGPAYVYTDEAGYQHVYYLTGPYVVMPLPAMPDTSSEESAANSDNDEGVVSYGPVCHEPAPVPAPEQTQYDFINKPYEEWTQEDYARYYGDC